MGAFTTKLTLRKKLTNCPQTLGLGQSHLISWVFQANLSLLTVKRSIFKCITLGHTLKISDQRSLSSNFQKGQWEIEGSELGP